MTEEMKTHESPMGHIDHQYSIFPLLSSPTTPTAARDALDTILDLVGDPKVYRDLIWKAREARQGKVPKGNKRLWDWVKARKEAPPLASRVVEFPKKVEKK